MENAQMSDVDTNKPISVEVAYATPEKQKIIVLQVPEGTVALDAVKQSGITDQFPEIDLESATLGVFSQVLGTKGLAPPESYVMQERDRIEIYRPLIADPKEVRKKRAEKLKSS